MAKVRSPNYPAINLGDAIAKAKLVHEKEFNHPADRETLVKDMGYGGINGASSQVFSAVTKYGLLEPVDSDRYRITPDAINIILHQRGERERVEAIERCAFLPPLFAELRAAFLNSLPSDDNLRVYLIKKGFNPKSVGDVIRAYRDTVELVTEETKGYNVARSSDARSEQGQQMQEFNPSASGQQQSRHAGAASTSPASLGKGVYEFSFPLSFHRDVKAVITLYGEKIKRRDLEFLKKKVEDLLEGFEDEEPEVKETQLPTPFVLPRDAIWRNKDHDQPVKVLAVQGVHDGRRYVKIEGSDTGVPEDELEFE